MHTADCSVMSTSLPPSMQLANKVSLKSFYIRYSKKKTLICKKKDPYLQNKKTLICRKKRPLFVEKKTLIKQGSNKTRVDWKIWVTAAYGLNAARI